ncbi:hypothetical protein [Lentimicrobium sp. S6]|uniref:hypothetical protein n=1 Tax=Lentimicrobium sp. S6 TaxID=2735872 RepID=UPI0015582248|nr:hypothetical protein [Lentimicrobium sp. S6]NPD47730.1 hypothetical protein [Lentimicrobium sp. S6]
MKYIYIIIIASVLMSCNKKSSDVEEQYNLDVGFEFSIVNTQNQDLLDTITENHYLESEIKLFYLVNGILEEPNNPQYDHPRNFNIYLHQNEYRIGLSMNHNDPSDKTTTFIHWNDNDVDTLETSLNRTNNAIQKRKVWLNGVLIWDWTTNEEGYFQIVKN